MIEVPELLRIRMPDVAYPTWTVPESMPVCRVMAFTGLFTTDATVGDRYPQFVCYDPAGFTVWQSASTIAHAPSTTLRHTWLANAPEHGDANSAHMHPLGYALSRPGDRLAVGNVLPGDLFENPMLTLHLMPMP
ncbi:MAG: hypothetical protein ACWGPR_12260 [Candidatus Deferrimicrobiaceae bacterium]